MRKSFVLILLLINAFSFSQSIDYKYLEQLFEGRDYEKCLNKCEKILDKGADDPLPYFFKALSLSNLLTDKKIVSNYIDPYRECLDNIGTAKNFSNSPELFSAYRKEIEKFQRKIVSQIQRITRKGMENEAEVYLKKLKQVFDGKAPFDFVLELDIQNLYIEQINNYIGNNNFEKAEEVIQKFILFSGEEALKENAPALAESFREKSVMLFSEGNKKAAETVFDAYIRFKSIAAGTKVSALNAKPEFDVWTADEMKTANTAATVDYMTDLEKEVVLYINLVRINPEKFCDTYLDNYVKSLFKNQKKVTVNHKQYDYSSLIKSEYYYSSLYKTLRKLKPLNAVQPSKELYLFAQCWAEEAGILGVIGHNRKNCAKGNFSECCQYGYDEALMIVLDLLIDEGIVSFGHRNIILGENTEVGVSFKPHAKYDNNTVIDFY